MNGQRLSATVHLPMNLRSAERTLDRDRNAQADSAIVGAGLNVGLQVSGERHSHAPVAGMYIPSAVDFRAGIGARSDAAVAGLDIQGVEPSVQIHMAVTSGGF